MKPGVPAFEIRRIRQGDSEQPFKCKTNALTAYFRKHAFDNDSRSTALTYVAVTNDGQVLGYYASAMASVKSADVAGSLTWEPPRYDLPVALMCRLATRKGLEGQGIGTRLLFHMFDTVAQTADKLGCLGIAVDAKDNEALTFYGKRGFEALPASPEQPEWPKRMFLHIATIREALGRRNP